MTLTTAPNKHAIRVKYLGPTNFRGSRIKLTDERFEQSVTISFDDQYAYTDEQAEAWLIRHGYTIFCQSELGASEYLMMVNEFRGIKSQESTDHAQAQYDLMDMYAKELNK